MVYSHSQVQLYKQCELRYAYKYIDRIPVPAEASLHLALGTSVHGALEFLYKEVQRLKVPSKESILEEYHSIRNEQITKIQEENKRSQLDQQQVADFAHMGVEYINWYYSTYHPFDQSIVMSTEEKVFPKLDDDIKFRWQIDRIDTQDDTFTIVDYKTSKRYPKDTDETFKDQINLYGRAIKQNYGSKFKKLIAKIVYLHLRNEIAREVTDEEMEKTRIKYSSIIQEIIKKTQRRSNGDKEAFKPVQWYRCDSCPFKMICPLFAHNYIHDEAVNLDDMKPTTIKAVIDEMAQMAYEIKGLEEQKDSYAKILGNYAAEKGYKRLYGNENKVIIGKSENYSPLPEKKNELESKLASENMLDDVVDIDRFKLTKKFKEHELDYDQYQDLVKKSVSVTAQRPSKLKEKEIDEYMDIIGEE